MRPGRRSRVQYRAATGPDSLPESTAGRKSPRALRRARRITPLDAASSARDNEDVAERAELQWVSLEPDPVIETYKRDVDRTLIRENLKLTPDERIKKMISVLRFVEEVRRTSKSGK